MFPVLSVVGKLRETPVLQEVVDNDSGRSPREAATNRDRGIPILKYDDPVLARPHPAFDMGMGHDSLPQCIALYSSTDEQQQQQQQQQRLPLATGRLVGSGSGSSRLRCRRQGRYSKDDTTAILKAMIPNKEWTTEAGDLVQTVSSTELCRAELESLQSKVDERLTNLQARPGPVCAVREEMFSELYDEVIREITLECPERGLLLLRLRDEARLTLGIYAEIYRDSVVFSRRKAEGAREELAGVRCMLAELKGQTTCLRVQVRSLEAELAMANRSNDYMKTTTEKEHSEKLQVVRAEQKAFESAIAKTQKKLREANVAAEAS